MKVKSTMTKIKKEHILELFGITCSCGCNPLFKIKFFGVIHWWKYNKIRKWWRTYTFYSYRREQYKHGMNMTFEEWKHWYENKNTKS